MATNSVLCSTVHKAVLLSTMVWCASRPCCYNESNTSCSMCVLLLWFETRVFQCHVCQINQESYLQDGRSVLYKVGRKQTFISLYVGIHALCSFGFLRTSRSPRHQKFGKMNTCLNHFSSLYPKHEQEDC